MHGLLLVPLMPQVHLTRIKIVLNETVLILKQTNIAWHIGLTLFSDNMKGFPNSYKSNVINVWQLTVVLCNNISNIVSLFAIRCFSSY